MASKSKGDFDALVTSAIDYGLDGWEQTDLAILQDFLINVLERPDRTDKLNQYWKRTLPRIAFFSGPDAPSDQPAIVQVFTRVLKAIEKKIT